jgi:hypothetical protein
MVTKRIKNNNVNRRVKAGLHEAESSVDIIEVTEPWRKLYNEEFCNINIIQPIKNGKVTYRDKQHAGRNERSINNIRKRKRN